MEKQLFNELFFNVKKEVFYEILENPDRGFGFRAKLELIYLTDLQVDTLDFLLKCNEKRLLGYLTLTFSTESVGEIKPISRTIEKIEKKEQAFIISNTY